MWKIRGIVSKGDYNYAIVPEHPYSIKYGYVLEHRVIVENHLGRLLTKHEIVHHINGNKKDNRIENLEVLSNKDHVSRHQKMVGRSYVELKCPNCRKLFCRPKDLSFLQKGSEYSCCSRRCSGKFSSIIQYGERTHEVELAISENLVREYRQYSTDNPEQTD